MIIPGTMWQLAPPPASWGQTSQPALRIPSSAIWHPTTCGPCKVREVILHREGLWHNKRRQLPRQNLCHCSDSGHNSVLCLLLTVDLRLKYPDARVSGPVTSLKRFHTACLFRACEDAAVTLQKTTLNLVCFGLFPSRYRIYHHPAEISDPVHGCD